ncbi:MAG TPA: division/cell wall cluster transcriptional repressor MraZ [Bacteroidota bacterium]|nr:division/cell wall cluster transcriptional repressor MraZ [Bacteroidota bacterium]
MSSFKGSYQFTVDSKGRINLPAKMRKNIAPEAGDTFVLTRGYETCIFVYPNDEWLLLEESIRKLHTSNPKHRQFMRTLLELATEVQIDSASRLMLPKDLLQFARIENDVKIIGVLGHIEVWNPSVYAEYQAARAESYEDIAAAVWSQSFEG